MLDTYDYERGYIQNVAHNLFEEDPFSHFRPGLSPHATNTLLLTELYHRDSYLFLSDINMHRFRMILRMIANASLVQKNVRDLKPIENWLHSIVSRDEITTIIVIVLTNGANILS